MWQGQANNESLMYNAAQTHEHNHHTNGNIPMDNLQQFYTQETMSFFPNVVLPLQVGNSPTQTVAQPYTSFVNNVIPPEAYEAPNMVHNHHRSHNILDFEADNSALLRSMATGYSYGNTGFNTIDRMSFCNNDINLINQGTKRKSEEDYSPFYTGVKRRITDEHMAAEMTTLYITNEHNYCNHQAMFSPKNDLNMQFSVLSDDMKDEDKNDCIDKDKMKEYPVFEFTAPLEQMLKKKDDILPTKIIEEICKPCLAMVPWSPPLQSVSKIQEKKQEERIATVADEMEDENSIQREKIHI